MPLQIGYESAAFRLVEHLLDHFAVLGVFVSPSKAVRRTSRFTWRGTVSAGEQTITVIVPRRPTRAGIDPDNLLIDLKVDDNITSEEIRN